MSIAEVVFFAADPHSVSGRDAPLLIGREIKTIRQKVQAARYRDRIRLHENWDTQTDDMVHALRDKRPDVVHFSGHGGSRGLVMVGPDGDRAHHLDAPELEAFFDAFKGRIKLVVLNACYSVPQAEAIRDAIGCAIGTPGKISDPAAIAFSAAFYSGIAFGESVQQAFDRARAKLRADHFAQREYPQLLHREDVDPAKLYLIEPESALLITPPPPERPATSLLRRAALVATVIAIAGGGGYMIHDAATRDPRLDSNGATEAAREAERLTPDSAFAAALTLHTAGNDSFALPYFQRAANANIAEAMAFLGTAYLDGKGTERQPVLGATWVRKAAEAGSVRGMLRLALAYQRGEGVSHNRRPARNWLLKAAARGSAEAMRNLGMLYREEFVADSGYAPVLHWLRMAADSGSLDALVDLGSLYEKGEGVSPDTAEALRLYRSAAQEESARAMVALGEFFQRRGDHAQALEWYGRGAKQGDADALHHLAAMYENGWGVPADADEARRLYEEAADSGSVVARAKLDAMPDD